MVGMLELSQQADPPRARESARRLILSLHDVSPRFEGPIDRLSDRLRAAGGHRQAMLVVPNFWGAAPILPGSPFAARLRGWAEAGVELFLHGFFHRDDSRHRSWIARARAAHMTAGEGEFLGLDMQKAVRRIADGRDLIEGITGRPIAGFVAPAWLYGAGAMRALREAQVALAEDHWTVWRPVDGRVVARSPVITWATRSAMRERSSLLVAALAQRLLMPRVMRVGVHPNDVRSAAVCRSISATVAALGRDRVISGYADLLADATCAS